MKPPEQLIKLAVDGDKNALEQLVVSVQEMIYNLALRMLWHPEDARVFNLFKPRTFKQH